MDDFLDRIRELERTRFSVNEYRGLRDASPFTLIEGEIPVIVSAPHAVTHLREGHVKASEDFTGPIALELARATGAHAVVATRFADADPNFDPLETSAYKQALVKHVAERKIKLVIDLHGMMTASPAIVAMGTGDGANVEAWPEVTDLAITVVKEKIAPFAEKHGKQIALDGRYAARDTNTVAATAARTCGIAALQIELSTLVRYPGGLVGRTPRGETNPFPSTALSPELSARKNPDTHAVEAMFAALVEITKRASAALHASLSA